MIHTKTLSPVHLIDGYYFKREDLFRPFDDLNVNGGKLRQCFEIVALNQPKEIITYSSINSPQLGLVSAVGRQYNVPVKFLLGGSTDTPYTRLAKQLGAEIFRLPCARDSYLLSVSKKIVKAGSLIIKSGIIDPANISQQIMVTADQVANVPDEVERVVLTCGSGLTAIGLIAGICKFRKNIKRLDLIGTAPDRSAFINDRLIRMGYTDLRLSLNFYSLYSAPGYDYEKKQKFNWGPITFHPQYEAKTFSWYFDNVTSDKGKTLFWIVGGEII
jgi:1-aminocyclopropane-1-carboxylate deaminase/D-cysteine desulfhydrase-like pyridoxal-dependent ACC family enzyme